MSGSWAMDETSFDGIHNDLYLDQEGYQVTGIEVAGWHFAAEDSAAVSGSVSGTAWVTVFNLRLVDNRTGAVTTFVGEQVSNNELQGTVTWAPDSSMTVRFFRDP